MQYGTVKWFNDAKGFRSLQEGQRVSYEVTQGPKGAQAAGVQPVA
jgi:CspA family cold shock protein